MNQGIASRHRLTLGLLLALSTVSSCAVHNPPLRPLVFVPRHEVDVLTQHGNTARTGANVFETRLNPDNVSSADFGRLFSWDVDGEIYAQPLYVSQVLYGGRAINMVIVATMNNSVYAFEAPAANSTAQPSTTNLWKTDRASLGDPLPHNFFAMKWWILGHNIDSPIGIVSTPVIDRDRNLIYLTVKLGHKGFFGIGRRINYRIFALDLSTGVVRRSQDIVAGVRNLGFPAGAFDAEHHLQRAALLEIGDSVYAAFASHQDTTPYHGWVVQFDADTLGVKHAFCTSCAPGPTASCDKSACMGGIWQAGGGPAADTTGNIYLISGNGPFDGAGAVVGTSFIKLDRDLRFVGSWTPPNYACLTTTDSDLGSAGPLILGDTVLVGGGKQGILYAIDSASMQGPQVGPGRALGLGDVPGDPCAVTPVTARADGVQTSWSIQAAPLWQGSAIMDLLRLIAPSGLAQGYHHIHGAPVLWTVQDANTGQKNLLYLSAERDVLRAFVFDKGFPGASLPGKQPIDTFESRCPNSHWGMPGGFLTLSADGTNPETGIIWGTMPRRNKDALNHTVPGVLRAYRAIPGASGFLDELWNSDEGSNPISDHQCGPHTPVVTDDELGKFAKFAPPTVSEGKVYVGTFSKELVVYGLRPHEDMATLTNMLQEHNANLTLGSLPVTVNPGDIVSVYVEARNVGTAPWQPADLAGLDSKIAPDFREEVVEGAQALQIRRIVQPGDSYRFSFHLRLPTEEGVYYYNWQLTAAAASRVRNRDRWFGAATAEWRVEVLNPKCDDLRAQATALAARIPMPTTNLTLAPAEAAPIIELVKRAEARGCQLQSSSVGMDMPAN
jgi:hypothetical protein